MQNKTFSVLLTLNDSQGDPVMEMICMIKVLSKIICDNKVIKRTIYKKSITSTYKTYLLYRE